MYIPPQDLSLLCSREVMQENPSPLPPCRHDTSAFALCLNRLTFRSSRHATGWSSPLASIALNPNSAWNVVVRDGEIPVLMIIAFRLVSPEHRSNTTIGTFGSSKNGCDFLTLSIFLAGMLWDGLYETPIWQPTLCAHFTNTLSSYFSRPASLPPDL
jgi:hypothetical protein